MAKQQIANPTSVRIVAIGFSLVVAATIAAKYALLTAA